MFNIKFGKEFLNQKPEALKLLEKRLIKYLFDPDSKFLAKLPKLQRKLRHEKKISEELLKAKIDIGSMIFYDLRGRNKRKTRNMNLGKEKILSISKNFTSSPIKDVVGNALNKIKFWDKNSKRLKNFFKKNLMKNREEIDENEENISNKDLDSKDYKTHREKANLKLNIYNSNENNNLNTNIISNDSISNTISKNFLKLTSHVSNKSVVFGNYDKMEPSSLDTRNNESNSFGKKDSLTKRSSINKSIENNLDGDKFECINSRNYDKK